MVRCYDIYVCPVCNHAFQTEDEAQACLWDHDVEVTAGFICDCGKAFISELEFDLHISRCGRVEPGCNSCNYYDAGKRYAPCPRPYFSENMSSCNEYRKLKVAP